jgi:hypothetical protein
MMMIRYERPRGTVGILPPARCPLATRGWARTCIDMDERRGTQRSVEVPYGGEGMWCKGAPREGASRGGLVGRTGPPPLPRFFPPPPPLLPSSLVDIYACALVMAWGRCDVAPRTKNE